jgi:hypothetical protein
MSDIKIKRQKVMVPESSSLNTQRRTMFSLFQRRNQEPAMKEDYKYTLRIDGDEFNLNNVKGVDVDLEQDVSLLEMAKENPKLAEEILLEAHDAIMWNSKMDWEKTNSKTYELGFNALKYGYAAVHYLPIVSLGQEDRKTIDHFFYMPKNDNVRNNMQMFHMLRTLCPTVDALQMPDNIYIENQLFTNEKTNIEDLLEKSKKILNEYRQSKGPIFNDLENIVGLNQAIKLSSNNYHFSQIERECENLLGKNFAQVKKNKSELENSKIEFEKMSEKHQGIFATIKCDSGRELALVLLKNDSELGYVIMPRIDFELAQTPIKYAQAKIDEINKYNKDVQNRVQKAFDEKDWCELKETIAEIERWKLNCNAEDYIQRAESQANELIKTDYTNELIGKLNAAYLKNDMEICAEQLKLLTNTKSIEIKPGICIDYKSELTSEQKAFVEIAKNAVLTHKTKEFNQNLFNELSAVIDSSKAETPEQQEYESIKACLEVLEKYEDNEYKKYKLNANNAQIVDVINRKAEEFGLTKDYEHVHSFVD